MSMRLVLQVSVIISFLCLCACEGDAVTTTSSIAEARPLAQAPLQESASEPYKIVMLGDSLTAGFGLTQNQALPEVLEQKLNERGLAVDLINAGVSGDTTANGLARYDWSVGSVDANMMIVALGANDYIQGVSPQRVQDNLIAIVEKAKQADIKVIIAGIETRSAATTSREAAYGRIYAQAAEAASVALYPALLKGVRDNQSLLQSDGLHPTAGGVNIMADNLAEFLQPILEDAL